MATTSPNITAPSPGPPEASTNVTAPPLATISPPPPSDAPTTPPAPDASEMPATPPPTESPPPVVASPPPADVTSPPPSPPSNTPPAPGATPVPPTSPTPAKTAPNAPPSSNKSPVPASPVRTPPVPPSADKTPGTTPATNVHSPPPPPMAHSKASPDTPSNTNGSSGSSDLNLPVVIGVSAAVGAVIIILALVACICCLKKKKKRRHDHYSDYGGGSKANQYYNGGNLPTKWSPPLSDPSNAPSPHGALPPPPGAPWAQPPPPPPPLGFNSSDMSSGPHGPPLPPPSPSVALGFGSKSTFTFEELSAATNGFSQGNLIGQGGFGYVYKGVLLNGKEVAVKQLKAGSGQGEREFQAEVEIISRVHHRYLVSLVGYCMAGSQRMLIYEFVSNGTLEYHLHGKGVPTMDWPTRLNIALGSAKGLAYLHEDCHPRIIHRDIKSANILLEDNFDAKVADFGLAKFTEDTNTHVSTRIMGTFGYLAPEYASSGKLTEKSDVFSFGVMLLELITGRRPVDTSIMDDSLVDWARPVMIHALAEDKFEDLVDPRLNGNYNIVEMQRMVASAAACVRHSARRRPKMSQIVRALEGDVSLEDLNEGIRPGQSMLFSSSSDYDSSSYTSNMRQFRRVALDSTDYGNEYSGPTSEYGLNPSDSSSSGEVSTGIRKHHR